ncbi:hypothetical protein CRV24_006654 [Beauveria bassiana]|nr:hypothetical protein CRV24_006654 [Beauveria bassiana]
MGLMGSLGIWRTTMAGFLKKDFEINRRRQGRVAMQLESQPGRPVASLANTDFKIGAMVPAGVGDGVEESAGLPLRAGHGSVSTRYSGSNIRMKMHITTKRHL